ncbi:MAG: rhomboid family intramembrane serine protease [Chloroflexi bacterium]|nr:rhomboid family intramembrane serine protease [Chloroflexota bacterium]
MQKISILKNPIIYIFSVCLVIEIAVWISPELIHYLAVFTDIWYKEPWTLVTSMFTHSNSDIWHLLFNMVTLYFLGNYLYNMIGAKRFLIVYFLAGIIGNLFFILIFQLLNPDTIGATVGASGAIFGIGATLAVLKPMSKIIIFPIPVPIPMWVGIVGLLIIMTFISYSGASIAWEAHLGGAIIGAIYGVFLRQVTFKYYYRNKHY